MEKKKRNIVPAYCGTYKINKRRFRRKTKARKKLAVKQTGGDDHPWRDRNKEYFILLQIMLTYFLKELEKNKQYKEEIKENWEIGEFYSGDCPTRKEIPNNNEYFERYTYTYKVDETELNKIVKSVFNEHYSIGEYKKYKNNNNNRFFNIIKKSKELFVTLRDSLESIMIIPIEKPSSNPDKTQHDIGFAKSCVLKAYYNGQDTPTEYYFIDDCYDLKYKTGILLSTTRKKPGDMFNIPIIPTLEKIIKLINIKKDEEKRQTQEEKLNENVPITDIVKSLPLYDLATEGQKVSYTVAPGSIREDYDVPPSLPVSVDETGEVDDNEKPSGGRKTRRLKHRKTKRHMTKRRMTKRQHKKNLRKTKKYSGGGELTAVGMTGQCQPSQEVFKIIKKESKSICNEFLKYIRNDANPENVLYKEIIKKETTASYNQKRDMVLHEFVLVTPKKIKINDIEIVFDKFKFSTDYDEAHNQTQRIDSLFGPKLKYFLLFIVSFNFNKCNGTIQIQTKQSITSNDKNEIDKSIETLIEETNKQSSKNVETNEIEDLDEVDESLRNSNNNVGGRHKKTTHKRRRKNTRKRKTYRKK